MQSSPIRVMIIDDHILVRSALQLLLDAQPGIMVVGGSANRAESLAVLRTTSPEVVVLDLDLGPERGIDLIPILQDALPELRIVILTGIHNQAEYLSAIRSGALGVVLKEQAVPTLVEAISFVAAGKAWLDPSLVAQVLEERAVGQVSASDTARIATLTERERAVIQLICESLKNRQIGQRLGISEVTVGHHLTSIFSKLGVTTRLELMNYAFQHGLGQLPTK